MRRRITVYVDEMLLRATRIVAVRTGKRYHEVVEDALRSYLGIELLHSAGKQSDLGGAAALKVAYREIHDSRSRTIRA